MRLLLTFFWSMPHIGGANTYIYILKKVLEEHGHEVDILASHPDGTKIYLVTTGKAIEKSAISDVVNGVVDRYFQRHAPHIEHWIRRREVERYTYELAAAYFDLSRYDIIHTQDQISARALWRVKPSFVPLVATINAPYAEELIYKRVVTSKLSHSWKYAKREEYLGAMSSDLTIVPSNWLGRELISKFSIPRDKLRVNPYGMDINAFLEQMNSEPNPPVKKAPNQFIMACPARLVHVKGHQVLIDALRIVKEKAIDFECWFIGDGELRNSLETYCLEKNVAEQVVFLGGRTDVPALLNQVDMVVLPSRLDTQPFAVIEAQTAGRAIVASNAGGIPEMIKHGQTGLLFTKQNSSQLADRILEVMNNEGLRRRLETNSKAHAIQRWSADALYERLMNVYNEAVQSKETRQATTQHINPDNRDGSRVFSCEVDRVENRELWGNIIKRLPANYSIPDTFLSEVLTEHVRAKKN